MAPETSPSAEKTSETKPPASTAPPAPPAPPAPTVPTTQELTTHGGVPDNFKTRFRPTFDPNIGIFKVSKRIPCEGGVYLVGDYIYPNDEKIDGRRLRLLFAQRYLDYPTNEEIEKFWNNPDHRTAARAKAAKNKIDEAEAEEKYNAEVKKKAIEEAKKANSNRVGSVNKIHDDRG